MTKLANPWKCDNPICGILRENDANHWLIVRLETEDFTPLVMIHPWINAAAELHNAKHACGIDCGLKIAAGLIEANFFTRKEGGND